VTQYLKGPTRRLHCENGFGDFQPKFRVLYTIACSAVCTVEKILAGQERTEHKFILMRSHLNICWPKAKHKFISMTSQSPSLDPIVVCMGARRPQIFIFQLPFLTHALDILPTSKPFIYCTKCHSEVHTARMLSHASHHLLACKNSLLVGWLEEQ